MKICRTNCEFGRGKDLIWDWYFEKWVLDVLNGVWRINIPGVHLLGINISFLEFNNCVVQLKGRRELLKQSIRQLIYPSTLTLHIFHSYHFCFLNLHTLLSLKQNPRVEMNKRVPSSLAHFFHVSERLEVRERESCKRCRLSRRTGIKGFIHFGKNKERSRKINISIMYRYFISSIKWSKSLIHSLHGILFADFLEIQYRENLVQRGRKVSFSQILLLLYCRHTTSQINHARFHPAEPNTPRERESELLGGMPKDWVPSPNLHKYSHLIHPFTPDSTSQFSSNRSVSNGTHSPSSISPIPKHKAVVSASFRDYIGSHKAADMDEAVRRRNLHITVRTTSAILALGLIVFVASHRNRARSSLVFAVNTKSFRDSRPTVMYEESIRTSFLYQISSARGFPPLETHTRLTDWFSRIVSPSVYPSILGAPGASGN